MIEETNILIQIALGSALIMGSIIIAGVFYWALETLTKALRGWSLRPPHGPKVMVLLCLSVLMSVAILSATIWMWAVTLRSLGIFGTLESSVFFALTAFRTLGLTENELPSAWRLLGGMAAANGFLGFGMITALLVESLRDLRSKQRDALE